MHHGVHDGSVGRLSVGGMVSENSGWVLIRVARVTVSTAPKRLTCENAVGLGVHLCTVTGITWIPP